MIAFPFIDKLRSAPSRWRTASAVACNVVLCEVGARIGLPGVDGGRVQHFFQTANHGLLTLYNLIVGGAVSRAAVLALGAIPYLQAEVYVRLARAASPSIKRLTTDTTTRRRAVRLATVCLALVQSLGFALFLEGIPGAVAEPGLGFLSWSVLLATTAAIAVGWLSEAIVGASLRDAEVADIQTAQEPPIKAQLESPASRDATILVDGSNAPILQAGDISKPSARATAHSDLQAAR